METINSKRCKFTFETAANSGSVIDLNVLEKVEAVNDTMKVKFILKEAQSTFVNNLVATGLSHEHAYSEDYAENPVGSGPYQLCNGTRATDDCKGKS